MLIPKIWLSPDGDGGGGQSPPPNAGGGEPQVPVAAPQPGQETPQAPQATPTGAAPGASSVPELSPEDKELLQSEGYPVSQAGMRLYLHDSANIRAQIRDAHQASEARRAQETAQTAEGQLMNELLSGVYSLKPQDFFADPQKAIAVALGTAFKKHTDLMGRAMLGQMDQKVQSAIQNAKEQGEKEVSYYMEHPEMIQYAQLNRDLRQNYRIPGSVAAKIIEDVFATVSTDGRTGRPQPGQQPPVGTYAIPPDLMTVAMSKNPSSLGIEMSSNTQGQPAQPDIWEQMQKETEALLAKGKNWDEAEAEVFAKHPEAFNKW